jgi:murein DD-endopeptidase MepM/ murein hydrolase activator NlpD
MRPQIRTTPSPLVLVPLVIAALLLGVVATSATPASAQARDERRLQHTRARIQQVKSGIDAARQRRGAEVDQLAAAERQLAVVLQGVAEAEAAVASQEQAVEDARRHLEDLESAEDRQRRLIAGRAATLYMQGSGQQEISALLAAQNPADAVARSLYMDVVTRADRSAVESVGIAQVAVDGQRKRLEAEEEGLRVVLAEQEAILDDVRALRNERALVVADVDQRLGRLEAEERHLEAERREMAALARRPARAVASRSAAGGDAAPAAGSGGWTWPARGSVTSEFGRRWGRMHEGIDVGAPTGSAVYAARAGRVSHAGRMGGYGNMTLIDHGGGVVTAYAHQSRIGVSVGQQVGAGQRIGSVGCTGSCTGPHLHFEVRVGGVARNPRGFLP